MTYKIAWLTMVLLGAHIYVYSLSPQPALLPDEVEITPPAPVADQEVSKNQAPSDNSAFDANPFFVTSGPFDTGETVDTRSNPALDSAIQLMEPF